MDMYKLQNLSQQPVVINCTGRVVHLLPGTFALVSDEEVKAAELQSFIAQGTITSRKVKSVKASVTKEGEEARKKTSTTSAKKVEEK